MNHDLSLAGMLQRKTFLKFFLPVAIIIGWEIIAIFLDNPFILPRLESVLSVLLNPTVDILGNGNLIDNAIISLERVVAGFIVATALAIPLGIGMGRSDTIHEVFDSVMQLLRPIPPLAWVPLALAWFKIGLVSMVFIIGMGAFFPILLNTLDGVRGVKKTWIEAAAILGARERQILTLVILPGAAPTIWTGMRVGFGIAWMCVVAAEMMPGTNSGIGYLIMSSYNWGQVPVIIAGIIVIGLIGIVVDYLFKLVERSSFKWRELER
jgi:NitT/TauT family transport system permease protein